MDDGWLDEAESRGCLRRGQAPSAPGAPGGQPRALGASKGAVEEAPGAPWGRPEAPLASEMSQAPRTPQVPGKVPEGAPAVQTQEEAGTALECRSQGPGLREEGAWKLAGGQQVWKCLQKKRTLEVCRH
jgi:hypothetical protein